MGNIAQVWDAMQKVLTVTADTLGPASGFVKRRSKVSGSVLAKTLVFGWLKNPQASLGELTQTTATLGVRLSAQGLDQRLGPLSVGFLKQVLEEGVQQMICAEPVAISILQRFNGVYVLDSSTVVLPDALASEWVGCGGSGPVGTSAALKLQVSINLCTGALGGSQLADGKAQDRNAPIQSLPLPAGALRIADLGYFSLAVLGNLSQQGVYWLSRIQVGTVVLDEQGRRWELGALLKAQKGPGVDVPILLGEKRRLACRLLAMRVPAEVARERRRRLRYDAHRKKQAVSETRLRLADWTILATNVPPELLTLEEALVLARARWQVELLFKLWKSQGGRIDSWRTGKRWRILCEVYAKLLAMLVQHWILLVSCWRYPNRSLVQAAQTIRGFALMLASAMAGVVTLHLVLAQIERCIAAGCRINSRKTRPNSYQLLMNVQSKA